MYKPSDMYLMMYIHVIVAASRKQIKNSFDNEIEAIWLMGRFDYFSRSGEKGKKESDAEWTNYIQKNDKLVGDFF